MWKYKKNSLKKLWAIYPQLFINFEVFRLVASIKRSVERGDRNCMITCSNLRFDNGIHDIFVQGLQGSISRLHL